LENIQIDVQDLTRGLENAKKELAIRQTMKVRCDLLKSIIKKRISLLSFSRISKFMY